jgi:hypothetical protein
MKNLYKYLIENDFVTPLNTMGIGNPVLPSDNSIGSGDIPIMKQKRKKKRKH